MPEHPQTIKMPIGPRVLPIASEHRPEGVKNFLSETRQSCGKLVVEDAVALLAPANVGKSEFFREFPIVARTEFNAETLSIDGSVLTTEQEITDKLEEIDRFTETHGDAGIVAADHIDKFVVLGSNATLNSLHVEFLRKILPEDGKRRPSEPKVVIATQGRQAEMMAGNPEGIEVPDILGSFNSETQIFKFLGLIQLDAALEILKTQKQFSNEDLYAAMGAIIAADRCDYGTVKRIRETRDWSFLAPPKTPPTPPAPEQRPAPVSNGESDTADRLDILHAATFISYAHQLPRRHGAMVIPGSEEALQAAGDRTKATLSARESSSAGPA